MLKQALPVKRNSLAVNSIKRFLINELEEGMGQFLIVGPLSLTPKLY
ncbi:hypothetical protein DB42_BQ00250 [Neochlamydia sp. EPS4]|nr:hypothetical protein DB42_BQ00250 [Neochlamydia sp. EPS4]